jgi:hypothetical protein
MTESMAESMTEGCIDGKQSRVQVAGAGLIHPALDSVLNSALP